METDFLKMGQKYFAEMELSKRDEFMLSFRSKLSVQKQTW